jgi:hypothetical protein
MPTAIVLFFEQLETRHYFPGLRDVSGSCGWDIVGAGIWLLQIKLGTLNIVKDGKKILADCFITCSQEDFMSIMQGQRNPLTAHLQGRITIVGDIGLAQICIRMFRLSNNPRQKEESSHE